MALTTTPSGQGMALTTTPSGWGMALTTTTSSAEDKERV
jgi:hypothetical protein